MKKAESILVEKIQKILNLKKGRVIVGISGVPGSGKTTFAKKLESLLDNSVFLPMDGFHYSLLELEQFDDPKEAFIRRGSDFTFNSKTFFTLLEKVKAGFGKENDITAPSFDHYVGDPIPGDILIKASHEVVIVEGNYVLLDSGYWDKITNLFDVRVFIKIDIDEAMERVRRRHISELRLSNEDAIKRVETNDRINAVLIDKVSSSRCDISINSVFDESYDTQTKKE